jgi:hypothetical protein
MVNPMNKLFLLIFLLSVTNCVSVKIGDPTSKKSNHYSFEAPNRDFYRIKDEAVDVAWLSQKTSSTLSVKSKCMKNIDVDLDNWILELASNFKASEIISSEKFKFNNRKALKAELQTSLEGFENKLAITSFIKNSCQYIIVLTSASSSYSQDIPIYDSFLSSFKAW